jgi:hypothetical protein
MRMSTSPLLLAALPLLAGCWGNKEVEFPPGLAPLEPNTAPWPEPSGGEDYPEAIELVSGEDEVLWVHARAYVHADLSTTWEALRDPDVNADRRRLESWEVSWDVPQEYDYCYRIHVVVVDLVTLEWDIDWNHGVINGSLEEPEAVGVRWFKSEGSSLIDLQAGSIAAYQLEEAVTALEIIYQIDAPVTTEDDLLEYVGDLYADVVAWVHGDPLPSFDSSR